MRDDIANLVYPVITHALALKERLARGDRPNIQAEQAALKGLLGTATQAAPWGSGGAPVQHSNAGRRPGFLGIRYALACWLDEIFVESSWGPVWNEEKLEQELYQSNSRHATFWEQARLAEAMPGADATEAFLLCVLLGFRGELADQSEQLRQWVENARTRVGKTQSAPAPTVPEGTMEANVPVLSGSERHTKMVKIVSVGLVCLVPVVVFLVMVLLS